MKCKMKVKEFVKSRNGSQTNSIDNGIIKRLVTSQI